MDYGLMLSTEIGSRKIDAEFHHLGEKDASAFKLSVPVKIGNTGIGVTSTYMGGGFFSKEPSKRFGFTDLQNLLGLDLGKLSTSMGMSFPKGKSAKFDVEIFRPIKNGKLGLQVFKRPDGEVVAGFIVVKLFK
jgi:hypothetical protein